jgi:hypothetical protein
MRAGVSLPILLAGLAAIAAPAAAEPAERSSTVIVYGDDRCPESTNDEVVVCARRPEGERYRIPKELREKQRLPGGIAWGSQVSQLEQETRFTRPNGCSAVGSFGATGCFAQAIRQWAAERRAAKAEAQSVP